MSTTLRLSHILGRSVPVEWFEAVALVREVADRVRDSVGGRAVPELDQVQLASDGTVSITGTAKADEPVRRMGQLLQACLVQADPPVQLRLVVAQATSPEPTFGSIGDYSEALAYFERPDRPSVLRSLYEKAQSVSLSGLEEASTLDAIAPLQSVEPEKKRPHDPAPGVHRPASRAAVLAIAAVVMVVAAITVYSQFSAAAPLGTEVSALAVKTSDAVGTTLVKGISAVSETVGLGRLVPAEGSGAPAPAKPAVQSTPKRVDAHIRKPASEPTGSLPTQPFKVFDLAPPLELSAPGTVIATEVAISSPESSPVGTAADQKVYSPDDATVIAPIGVRPQLPHVLPNDVRKEQLSQIELVVLADGTVGSVRLLGTRKGVLDAMLLSAAKAWTFKPAEKDGRPVAYRKTVWLVRD
jgi:hypothetical protein